MGHGVRVRATIAATLAFSVALAAGAWFVVDRQRSALTADLETTVRLRADDLGAALAAGELPESVAVPVEDRAFAQIVDGSGEVVRASPNVEGEPVLASFAVPTSGYVAHPVEIGALSDTAFTVVGRQVRSGPSVLSLYVGASLEPVDESVRELGTTLAIGAPLLLLMVAALTWVVVGRALRPVDEAAARERRFVADASHEMRSPLTGMRAQLEVDLAHPETADWQATEREVLDETLRLQRLVDDLLVLARAEAPVDRPQRELVDLDDLVLKGVRRLRVRGKVRIDAGAVHPVQVVADPDALTRVVHNLLDNAERHGRGEVVVTVQENGSHVEVTVTDDGPGVPAERRESIFERFFRSDDARSRDRGGAGLGLAIAQQIVTAHGGTLTLEPTHAGARFVVRLPS
ncbi:MAG TPA: HAMP domain-containing sensor histidine kinase [Acidimicrobiales bacterium]|nr:HAMP domain-containing sensor histidine kinase [Acidimicrobiales bacterium]